MGLRNENQKLVEENRMLRALLYNVVPKDFVSSDSVMAQYTVTTGRVIKNSYASPRNFITINKGEQDGISIDMGVVTEKGILGIVERTSKRYATVQSILNEGSNINAKILHTDYFGSLVWNGKDYQTVQLVDIPRLVPLTLGDTIVTGAMSSIFPEGIPIGVISKYDLDISKSFYIIEVALFNDMTNVRNVYIVKNSDRREIKELENQTEENDQ